MGAAAGLATAVFAAGTNLLLRREFAKIGGATAQTWRAVVATLLYLLIFLALRDARTLLALPLVPVLILLASVLLNMVIGDLLQFAAINRLGIALAMPITASSPLLTLLIASVTLGEQFTARALVGTVLVVLGVILVALPRRALYAATTPQPHATSEHWLGVSLAAASAVCMALAAILTRAALHDIEPITANMLRLPFGALLCMMIGTVQRRRPPWAVERSSLLPLCLSGVTGLGSSICFLLAIQLVGASTTATLNAAAPIFGLLGAVLFLGERPTRRNIVGTLIAFVGVTLVV